MEKSRTNVQKLMVSHERISLDLAHTHVFSEFFLTLLFSSLLHCVQTATSLVGDTIVSLQEIEMNIEQQIEAEYIRPLRMVCQSTGICIARMGRERE